MTRQSGVGLRRRDNAEVPRIEVCASKIYREILYMTCTGDTAGAALRRLLGP